MPITLTPFEQQLLDTFTGSRLIDTTKRGARRGIEIKNEGSAGAYINGADISKAVTGIRWDYTWNGLVVGVRIYENQNSASVEEGIKFMNVPPGGRIYMRDCDINLIAEGSSNTDPVVANVNWALNPDTGFPKWNGQIIPGGELLVRDTTLTGGEDACFDSKMITYADNVTMNVTGINKRGYKAWGRRGRVHTLANCTIDLSKGNSKHAFWPLYKDCKIRLFNHKTIAKDGTVYMGIPPKELVRRTEYQGETPSMSVFSLLNENPLPAVSGFFSGEVAPPVVVPPVVLPPEPVPVVHPITQDEFIALLIRVRNLETQSLSHDARLAAVRAWINSANV